MDPYLRWGAVATTAGALLIFQGMHVFRRHAYEIFLVLHIILSVVFIIGCWYHVKLIPYDNYMPWLYASIALWAFDRAVRVLRIVWWNVRWSRAKGWRVTNAAITHLERGFVRLDVHPVKGWEVKPGQHVYLHVVGSFRDRPWESHPFTIYDHHVPEIALPPTLPPPQGEKKRTSGSPSSTPSSNVTPSSATMTFYIRPWNGMTSRLAQLAQRPSEESVVRHHPVLIEGPYGHSLPLHNFDNVTLIAGGVGMTALMPYFKHTSRMQRQRVHMIWIVHELASLHGIHRDILAFSSPSTTVSIYVTSQHEPASEVQSSFLLGLDKDLARVNIALGTGRPSCSALLAEEAETSTGSLAVVACGPAGLMDDCRAACVEMLDTKRAAIEFFSEEFGW
jgi:NAD(P)H-flavin reductase